MTDINALEEDDFTEVRKANVPRLDLVGSPAGGTKYLIMKAHDEGLLAPEAVERLLKDAAEPDLDETLIEPTGAAAAAASVPSSPEWEQVDSDSAANAYGILARVANTLEVLAEREAIEATVGDGDPDDMENVFDLEDAACAVEYAMDTVAVYAASEDIEADDDLTKSAAVREYRVRQATKDTHDEYIAKASAAADIVKAVTPLGGALTTVESFGSIRKAGRTLSAANESKLRSASEQITSVLASLPAAPDEMKKEAAPVATTEASEAITKSDTIEKADATDAAGLQAVFDANGNLVGVVDPTAIQAVTGATGGDADDDDSADDDAPAAPADPDAAPAPDEVGAPTDEVAKSVNIDELVKSAVAEQMASTVELVASLTKQVEFLGAPAAPKVFTNGADGTVPVTRDGAVLKGAADDDVTALIKAAQNAPDSATQTRINNLRGAMARDLLTKSRPTA